MTRAYKITRLPDGYCKVAVAAWKALSDRELFEIEGRLVFTDDLESYMEGGDRTAFCATNIIVFDYPYNCDYKFKDLTRAFSWYDIYYKYSLMKNRLS